MPVYSMRRSLSERLETLLARPELTAATIEGELSAPPTLELGHLAFPCFKLAKIFRNSTDRIAQEIAQKFNACADRGPGAPTATVAGPYVNFRWDLNWLFQETVGAVAREGARYGGDGSGGGKKVLVEYCSPNIAKKLAFQHIRSTLIGNSLANIYEMLGYSVERINFVGDWGTQFARLLAGFELYGDEAKLSADRATAMAHLFEIYVRFHKEVEQKPELLEKASECLQRLEAADERLMTLWKRVREISLATAEDTLRRMNVRFDVVEGESRYVPAIGKTLELVKMRANARLSEGAWIVEVPGLATPALIQKKDGTTLYLTRDIAAAIDRFERFEFHKSLYVVSEQQKLHFQLLFGVLKLMGYHWADRCEHVSFGTVLFGAEKMSTREGRVIFLDDILDEAHRLALAECTAKNPGLPNKEKVAEQVGIGAILFGELSAQRQRDIEFDWSHILAFDGDTGPYVQYSAVRCRSLLEKAKRERGEDGGNLDVPGNYPFATEEETLLLALARFRVVLHLCVRDSEPSYLATFLIDLAKAFNRFYYRFPVLQSSDKGQRRVRLALTRATRQVLENGLRLLGIEAPDEM
jgi:arginyl-tRNA synthetase